MNSHLCLFFFLVHVVVARRTPSPGEFACDSLFSCTDRVSTLKQEVLQLDDTHQTAKHWLLRGLGFAQDALATGSVEEWDALAHTTRNQSKAKGGQRQSNQPHGDLAP